MAWFAKNTGTADAPNSCSNTQCGVGEKMAEDGICTPRENFSDDGKKCNPNKRITVFENLSNCCVAEPTDDDKVLDVFGNCCSDAKNKLVPLAPNHPNDYTGRPLDTMFNINSKKLCLGNTSSYGVAQFYMPNANSPYGTDTNNKKAMLVCVGDDKISATGTVRDGFPNGDGLRCDGHYVIIIYDMVTGAYFNPLYNGTTYGATYESSYNTRAPDSITRKRTYKKRTDDENGQWAWLGTGESVDDDDDDTKKEPQHCTITVTGQ